MLMANGNAVLRRGDDTRERLLDAVESLIAEQGFASLTHRTIAARAKAHVALLNYHFGSKEQLIEEALARRAPRLLQLQRDALAAVRTRGIWTVEDVLWAFWRPFTAIDRTTDPLWHNYLCLVVRLATSDPSDDMFARHFGSAQRECLYKLRKALPQLDESVLMRGFRQCRILFEHEVLSRCRTCEIEPAAMRTRSAELIAFLSGGLRALASPGANTLN
jgi:AcrR family transcriptional regulator